MTDDKNLRNALKDYIEQLHTRADERAESNFHCCVRELEEVILALRAVLDQGKTA